jgi:hypothetical protein
VTTSRIRRRVPVARVVILLVAFEREIIGRVFDQRWVEAGDLSSGERPTP